MGRAQGDLMDLRKFIQNELKGFIGEPVTPRMLEKLRRVLQERLHAYGICDHHSHLQVSFDSNSGQVLISGDVPKPKYNESPPGNGLDVILDQIK